MAAINRAFWINIVKQHGDSGVVRIGREAHTQALETKAALDDLIGAAYIEQAAKADGTKRQIFTVTSFGHRYLNENQVELFAYKTKAQLLAQRRAATTAGHIETHRQPAAAPDTEAADETVKVDYDRGRMPHQTGGKTDAFKGAHDVKQVPDFEAPKVPDIAHASAELGVVRRGAEREVVHVEMPRPPIVTPQTVRAAGITSQDQLVEQIKSAAAPMLFEKFGEQVTLKDLVEYISGK